IPGYKNIIDNKITNKLIKIGVEGGEVINRGLTILIYLKKLIKREVINKLELYINYKLSASISPNNKLKEFDK
ncbi:hypothetical protein QR685DRAFT_441981, partial [Neurospora intermedia]